MNLKNKLDKKKRLNFFKFKAKYHIFKKSTKSVKGDKFSYKIDTKNNKWDFLKKILIYVLMFLLIFFVFIVFCNLFFNVCNMIKKVLTINFSYFIEIPYAVSTSPYDNRPFVRNYQCVVVDSALNSMYYNEYCFYLRPNTEAFIQSRMEYQSKLKILSDTVNFNAFVNSADELRFFTAFYEHYLKIIELNNDLIKTVSLNQQFYNNYKTFWVFFNNIMYVFYVSLLLFNIPFFLFKLKKNIKLNVVNICGLFGSLFALFNYFK